MSTERDSEAGCGESGSPRLSVGSCNGLFSRRTALLAGASTAAAVLFGNRYRLLANSPDIAASPTENKTLPAKAKAVIQVWLWGGPPQIDTFDPKPNAGGDYCGPLTGTLKTNVDGILIGDSLPELAKIADKYSIVRSLSHNQNGHETAAYLTQTGRMPDRNVYPSTGGIVGFFKGYDAGYKGLIPPYVVLTQPQGRFSEAGFLGVRYKPFCTGGNPADFKFAVEGIVTPGVSEEQQLRRRELLKAMNSLRALAKGDDQLAAAADAEKQAYDLILGDAGKVFDLSQEKDETRLRYGRGSFGQACLVARRLVEAGVRYVTVNSPGIGWDTHKDHFPLMRQFLPQLDKALSSLLNDLSEKGLLDSTIVWCCGEFGRTSKIAMESPWNGGRHHWGHVFSALVAGGGFKGGMVVGSSDAKAEYPKDRPVHPADLLGSMYELLGIDPEGTLPHPSGERLPITAAATDGLKLGGRLKEIM